MRPQATVDEWRRAVYRSTLSDAVKVYLLLLADHMKADRKVSVRRTVLAKKLNRHEQRVAERSKKAVDEGWLSVVSAGYRGNTAVYQGMIPDRGGAGMCTDRQGANESPQRYAFPPEMPDLPQEMGCSVGTPLVTKDRPEPDRTSVRVGVDQLHNDGIEESRRSA